MTHTNDQDRAEFEAWARDRYPSIDLTRDWNDYYKALAKDYWSLWQASRRAQVVHKCSECEDTGVGISHGYDCTSCYGALPAAPQPPEALKRENPATKPEAAPVQMPEPWGKEFGNGVWYNLYTENQVRQLLAQHGVK